MLRILRTIEILLYIARANYQGGVSVTMSKEMFDEIHHVICVNR